MYILEHHTQSNSLKGDHWPSTLLTAKIPGPTGKWSIFLRKQLHSNYNVMYTTAAPMARLITWHYADNNIARSDWYRITGLLWGVHGTACMCMEENRFAANIHNIHDCSILVSLALSYWPQHYYNNADKTALSATLASCTHMYALASPI